MVLTAADFDQKWSLDCYSIPPFFPVLTPSVEFLFRDQWPNLQTPLQLPQLGEMTSESLGNMFVLYDREKGESQQEHLNGKSKKRV